MAFITPTCLSSRSPSLPPPSSSSPSSCPLQVNICTGPSCADCGSRGMVHNLSHILGTAQVSTTACFGECGTGPNLILSHNNHHQLHKRVATISDLTRVLRTTPHVPNPLFLAQLHQFERANAAFSAKNFQTALNNYGELLSTPLATTLRRRTLCNRAALCLDMRLYERALQDANEAVDLEPDCIAAWMRKAQAHDKLRQWDMAQRAWIAWARLQGDERLAAKKIKPAWQRNLGAFLPDIAE